VTPELVANKLHEKRRTLSLSMDPSAASIAERRNPVPVVQLGLTMGLKFYTIKLKDRIGLGSGFVSIHF
jgi:hypothetical protein